MKKYYVYTDPYLLLLFLLARILSCEFVSPETLFEMDNFSNV